MRLDLRLFALAAVAVAVSGCAYAELHNVETGATATCGRIPIAPWLGYEGARAVVFEELGCIETAQGQGLRLTAR